MDATMHSMDPTSTVGGSTAVIVNLTLIKPIINSKSVYKETALKFMEQYYLGKDELEKYKEFLNKK